MKTSTWRKFWCKEKVKFQRSLIVIFNFFLYSGLLPRGILLRNCCLYNLRGTRVQLPLHHQDTISRTSPPSFISLFCITKVLIAVLSNFTSASTVLLHSFTSLLHFYNPLQQEHLQSGFFLKSWIFFEQTWSEKLTLSIDVYTRILSASKKKTVHLFTFAQGSAPQIGTRWSFSHHLLQFSQKGKKAWAVC